MGISSTTLAYASIASTVASTAFTMIGQQQQAAAQKGNLRHQEAIAQNNKTIMQYREADAKKRGQAAADDHRQKVLVLKGRQRAVMASTGFEINSDDAIDILADTAEMGELDALTIQNNADREAWGYAIEGSNAGNQAAMYGAQASNVSPLLSAGTTLFAGVGSVADKWTKRPKVT